MQYTTSALFKATMRVLPRWIHLCVVVCFLTLAILGQPPTASAGWVVLPPLTYDVCSPQRRSRPRRRSELHWSQAWGQVCRTWRLPLARSMALGMLWLASGRIGPWPLIAWPWAVWIWQVSGSLCPGLALQPEWQWLRWAGRTAERVLLLGYVGLALHSGAAWLVLSRSGGKAPLGALSVLGAGSLVEVSHEPEEGCYRAELSGRFTLAVADDDPFRFRLFVLFLRLLEDPSERRGSRRTRAGRTPFVRQQYLAQTLGIPHPDISRWERYWLLGDWRRLLSQHRGEVLTLELRQRIIETWAQWPQWGLEQVHRLLVEQGVRITETQVRQAAHESGWQIVRQVLGRLCVERAGELQLRDDWLLSDLLRQIEVLVARLEVGERQVPEEQLALAALQAAVDAAGLQSRPPRKAEPWLRRVESVLFAPWGEMAVEGVRCPECGSTHVGRKGRKPRRKKYMDEQGQLQEAQVYRYRCHNRDCPRESFTVFPPGLVPYSQQRLELRVLALQMYAWGYSTYRRTGQALGMTTMTAYRWVSAFGYQLLPVAALFGVVKSSGVIGVDEKWVQVPKNSKPAGKRRKWMYVYVAADAYTYDLVHIAVYAHNTAESAQAFLLALRAKGYHPRVVVTDLRQDYGPAIAHVFPQARHHECLFHAAQALHCQLADIYGWDAMKHDTYVMALRQAFDDPLQARTKRTAQRRYDQLMAQRDTWVEEKPELAAVFASLEAHWPKLVNGIESDLIPTTNNAVELVIRRFDQHYQNFCGFDSLQTAEQFLGVFEKVYRFTPFSDDAQPRIRGKSPLQLAGYSVDRLPMAAACSGWAIALPTEAPQRGVPSA